MATSCVYCLEPGNRTIVAFGDSTTATRAGVAYVYADLLRNELPDYGITGTVVNSGVGGNTTVMAMARFETDVLAYNPDLVIIQFGINDSMVDVWRNPPATQPRVALETYVSNLTYMVQTLKNAGTDVILMTPNPLRWTEQLLELYGQSPYVTNDPMGLNTTIVDYAQAVREIAETGHTGFVDVYNMYIDYDQQQGQTMDNLLLDGMHPNGTGHRLVANELEAIIVPEPTTVSVLSAGMLAAMARSKRAGKKIV